MNNLKIKAENLVNDLLTGSGASSVQYSLYHKGEFILSQGAGFYQKEGSILANANHLYGIGSVSKIYAVVSVMKLFEEGIIHIDEPLFHYIPEFKMKDERYLSITPRMLMNHSSGLYGTHFSDAFLFNDPSTKSHDQLLSKLSTEMLKYEPGTMSEYCNDGFTLLEILTEKITGLSYSEFLAEKIFKPLHITNTVSPLNAFDKTKLAKTYLPLSSIELPTDTLGVIGAGGLYSNTEDLCKFGQIFVSENKNPVLSKEYAKMMANPEYKKGIWVSHAENNVFSFGLGWDRVEPYSFLNKKFKVLFKGGDSMLYHSSLAILPELDIVMAVSSSGGMSIANLAFSLNIITTYLENQGIISESSNTPKALTYKKTAIPDKLRKYQGIYGNSMSSHHIEFEDNKLSLGKLFDGMIMPQAYFYVGEDKFLGEDNSTLIRFVEFSNEIIYLQVTAKLSLPNIGEMTWTAFDSQKLSPFALDEGLKSIWDKRKGKTYYLVSEGSSSQLYSLWNLLTGIKLNDDFDTGYAYGASKIINENLAINTASFRDVTDLSFFEYEGKEYLKARDLVYISQDDISTLSLENHQTYTINDMAYGSYYKIPHELSGKTITLDYEKGSAFALYDQNFVCQNYSTIDDKNVVTLPESGMLLLLGNPKAQFVLHY